MEATATQFESYSETHAARLREVLAGPEWREAESRGWIEAARRRLLTPPETENVFALPVAQLIALNGDRVRALIAAGERDEDRLLAALGTWPQRWPKPVPVRLSFLGLNLGFACDMRPRCVYCNQRPVTERLTAEDWKALLSDLAPAEGKGTYVYLTGGEPLMWREKLWGARGLIRAATRAGAACNLNTNALKLTPKAALGLVSSGLGRLHISLDTHRPEVQDAIHRKSGRWDQVVRGLHNLQIAKVLLDAKHPVIHLNCVLTNLNAWDFPDFLRFIVGMKPLVEGALSPDLDLHLIPVGGEQNRDLRLTAEEYERFFTETWAAVNVVWLEYQVARGVPEDQRGALEAKIPFLSPYHRVQQRGSLTEWARCAGEGQPANMAMMQRCYVAATQGFILPDGAQYWCGGHATSRPEAVGNVLQRSVRDNIRHGLGQLAAIPGPHCRNCPGATQAINQTVEGRLRQTIAEWLNPEQPAPAPNPQAERAFE
jgi:MoaA/NifB/PqqE/SkfB family radical SAM enzyme